ncbi:hypothetical protein CVN76_27465 [Bacillus sp. mrc49]|nr:hypothetical protein CVN76_27465 [Bacillus sp. mrc49]
MQELCATFHIFVIFLEYCLYQDIKSTIGAEAFFLHQVGGAILKGVILLILLIGSLFVQLLGIMDLIPLYFSSPILFFVFFIILHSRNQRNRFKGL